MADFGACLLGERAEGEPRPRGVVLRSREVDTPGRSPRGLAVLRPPKSRGAQAVPASSGKSVGRAETHGRFLRPGRNPRGSSDIRGSRRTSLNRRRSFLRQREGRRAGPGTTGSPQIRGEIRRARPKPRGRSGICGEVGAPGRTPGRSFGHLRGNSARQAETHEGLFCVRAKLASQAETHVGRRHRREVGAPSQTGGWMRASPYYVKPTRVRPMGATRVGQLLAGNAGVQR